MVTSITAGDNSHEDDDLIYTAEYLDIVDFKNRLHEEAKSKTTASYSSAFSKGCILLTKD